MNHFCGDLLFEYNTTWQSESPQLSSCFTRSILVIPGLVTSLASLLHSLYIVSTRKWLDPKPWSWILVSRVIIAVSAIICIIIQARMESLSGALYLVDTFFFAVNIFIPAFSVVDQVLMKSAGHFTSPLQFFCWLSHTIFLIPELVHLTLEPAFIAYYTLNCLMLLSQWIPNWSSDHPSENKAAYPEWITFSWMSSLFFKGYRSNIKIEDLPQVSDELDTVQIAQTFNYWRTHGVKSKDGKSGGQRSLLYTLFRSFGGTLTVSAILRLINDILLYLTPQVFRQIVHVIENKDMAWKGWVWVTLLLVVATSQVTISNHYFRSAFVAAFKMRTALTTAIYRKSLTISNSARKEFTTGEITNLMSVDTQRFMEVIPYVNSLWSGPFQFFLAIYFLFDLIGVSALVGIAVFGVLVPVNIVGGRFGRKIQSGQMRAKDGRILFMNEVLQGMKVLKLYAWEKPFMAKIDEFRSLEIKSLLQNAVLQACLWITYTAAPMVVTLATFICYVSIDPENNVITAEKIFGTVAIFNVVRIPMNQFPRIVMEAVKLMVSVKRIDKFLACPDLEEQEDNCNAGLGNGKNCAYNETNHEDEEALSMKNADYSWTEAGANPTLQNINMNVKKGELIAVVGKIGSGKSSLLSAILGEMQKTAGEKSVHGRISYVAQQAWIQNLTVRDNILFSSRFDEAKYESVIRACSLASDLDILPNHDMTEIGENGVNLSGGQKQRIGLARAAYNDSDIVLMDDPLSAVDAHVGKAIFDNLIGPNGLLQDRTRILVTHNLGFLHMMDKIYIFDEGQIVDEGSLVDLESRQSKYFQEIAQFIGKKEKEEAAKEEHDEKADVKKKDGADGKLIAKEKSAEGRVDVKHYNYYLKSMNIWMFLLVLFYFLCSEAFKVGGNLILADWTQDTGSQGNLKYLGYYTLMAILCSIFGMTSQISCNYRCAAASKKIHESMLAKTMHAPMVFFETNPIGRILNRFTSDMDIVDQKIPMQLRLFLSCLFMILSTFLVVASITPMILVPLAPISIAYVFLQVFFTRTRRQVKRLESVAKSPIFSHFTESITGAVTIRAFNQTHRFCRESEEKIAKHLFCNYISDMSNRWLSLRVEVLGNVIVFFAGLFAFYYGDSIGAGLAGLSISYAMQMIDGFGWTIRTAGELESDSVALERIREYEDLPQEAEWDTPEGKLPKNWPDKGQIEFQSYSTKYRPELPNVLQDFSLQVQEQEKVGIVGRTGAGKSSLSLALFRIIEPSSGTIVIDNLDITKIGLQDLRSRLTIIPQEPTLFSGSLRFNLDPGNQFSDHEINTAIQTAGLNIKEGLDDQLCEGGLGLSLGQRQMVCLARALLRRSRILILDEATAAVDGATDQRIQDTIRDQFKECSVLTIAHRLHTVTGGDRILVLDTGNLAEEGPPAKLMEDPSTRFYSMAKAAGLISTNTE